MLLEKAWAKIHGSYDSIELGFAHETLYDITGAPVEVLLTNEEKENNEYWLKILNSFQ